MLTETHVVHLHHATNYAQTAFRVSNTQFFVTDVADALM